MFAGSKMYKACELAENIKVEILIARFIRRLKKLVNRCNKYELMKKRFICCFGNHN